MPNNRLKLNDLIKIQKCKEKGIKLIVIKEIIVPASNSNKFIFLTN